MEVCYFLPTVSPWAFISPLSAHLCIAGKGHPVARRKGVFGNVENLSGGHYRARYTGPDGRRYKAPTMFLTTTEARQWLAVQQTNIVTKAWMPPEATQKVDTKLAFREYAKTWLANRRVKGEPLKVRTREHYQWLLNEHLLPTFGAKPIGSINAGDVRAWHDKMAYDGYPPGFQYPYATGIGAVVGASTARRPGEPTGTSLGR
jgi:hypothetical protein